jgi:hypothetical protein
MLSEEILMKSPFLITCVLLALACCCEGVEKLYAGKAVEKLTAELKKAEAAGTDVTVLDMDLSGIRRIFFTGNVIAVVGFGTTVIGLVIAFRFRKLWAGRPWTLSILIVFLALFSLLAVKPDPTSPNMPGRIPLLDPVIRQIKVGNIFVDTNGIACLPKEISMLTVDGKVLIQCAENRSRMVAYFRTRGGNWQVTNGLLYLDKEFDFSPRAAQRRLGFGDVQIAGLSLEISAEIKPHWYYVEETVD